MSVRPSSSLMLLTALVLAMFALCLRLGVWQLDRAAQKHALLARYEAGSQHVKSLPDPFPKDAKGQWQYQTVSLTGQFLNDKVILIENKVYRSRPGFEVIVPFELAGSNKIILISRGWIPRGEKYTDTPTIPPIKNMVKFNAMIDIPGVNPFILSTSNQPTTHGWPLRVLALDFPWLSTQLSQQLDPIVLRIDPTSDYAFKRSWEPVNMLPAKHTAYAFQWFAMAFMLVIALGIVWWRARSTHE